MFYFLLLTRLSFLDLESFLGVTTDLLLFTNSAAKSNTPSDDLLSRTFCMSTIFAAAYSLGILLVFLTVDFCWLSLPGMKVRDES